MPWRTWMFASPGWRPARTPAASAHPGKRKGGREEARAFSAEASSIVKSGKEKVILWLVVTFSCPSKCNCDGRNECMLHLVHSWSVARCFWLQFVTRTLALTSFFTSSFFTSASSAMLGDAKRSAEATGTAAMKLRRVSGAAFSPSLLALHLSATTEEEDLNAGTEGVRKAELELSARSDRRTMRERCAIIEEAAVT